MGLPGGARGREPTCQCRDVRGGGFDSWVRKTPWRREGQPTLVVLPREFHGQRNLPSYGPQGHREMNMTEVTHTYTTS